jgi:hypothetical protein
MPPQVKRLALLFAIFIGLFLVARNFLVPKSFGEFGHYRGLSLTENQDKPANYAGQKICNDCHDDVMAKKSASVHQSLSCETCHGPGQAHVNNNDTLPLKPSGREFCATCHTLNAARKKENIIQIDPAKHETGSACTECHNPHNPWENLK